MSLMSLTNSSRNLESASLLLMRPRPESPLKVLPNTEKEDMPPDLISETSSHRFFGKLILFSSWTVYVFAQDFTVIAGTVGTAHAEKIAYCIETARKIGVPVIGLYDSAGARIQEGLNVTRAIGKIFYQNSITSGTVPQISAIMGPCIGVAAYSPALTDFIIMVKGTSQMFITGPSVIKEVTGEEVSMEELGGTKIPSQVSAVADVFGRKPRCGLFRQSGQVHSLLRRIQYPDHHSRRRSRLLAGNKAGAPGHHPSWREDAVCVCRSVGP